MSKARQWVRRTGVVGMAVAWFLHPTKGADRRARAKQLWDDGYARSQRFLADRRAKRRSGSSRVPA